MRRRKLRADLTAFFQKIWFTHRLDARNYVFSVPLPDARFFQNREAIVPPEPEQQKKSIVKNPVLYTSLAILIAALYAGFVFFTRWNENRSIERQRANENTARQSASDRAALEQLGGKELAIQSFYATPSIRRGERAQLCYGVANAKTLTIDPPVGTLWPSHARCLDVSPTKDTTYTLTIQDAAGNAQTQSVTIQVH